MKFFALLCLSFLTACSQGSNMNSNHYANDPIRHDGTLPKATHEPRHIKINPNRKEHYQATIKLTDAPVQFNFAEGFEAYISLNCSYVTNTFAGSQGNPEFTPNFPVHKTGNNTYIADFYIDTPLDEDYYGNGLCHWELNTIAIFLHPTGNKKKEMHLLFNFDPDIFKKINSQNPIEYIVNQYPKEDFPISGNNTKLAGFASPSLADMHISMDSKIKPNDIFTAEIWIKKVEK